MRSHRGEHLWLLLILVFFAGEGSAAPEATVPSLYEQAVKARRDQRFDEAIEYLHQAEQLEPYNADILVQLGFAFLGKGSLVEAEASFLKVLVLAPDYLDANVGLAHIALRRGNLQKAHEKVDIVLAEQPDRQDARRIKDDLEVERLRTRYESTSKQARVSAPKPKIAEQTAKVWPTYGDERVLEDETLAENLGKRWRLDTGSEVSYLTNNRPSWYDSRAVISYRTSPETLLGLGLRHVKRGALQDFQVEGFIYHSLSETFAVSGKIAVAPDAEILPDLSVGGGASMTVSGTGSFLDRTVFSFDARGDFYSGDDILVLSPAVKLPILETLDLYVKYTHAISTGGVHSNDAVVRADFRPIEKILLFAGVSRGNEIDGSRTVDVDSIFAGGRWAFNERYGLTASYAKEFRSSFNRQTLGLSVSARF